MARNNNQAAFATFLILCPTSFFLGILFSLFPYDYPILWVRSNNDEGPDPQAFARLEAHLGFLYASPAIVQRIFHLVIATGLLGFFVKLYRPSESNLLFDGASLGLYMIAVIIYLTNISRGMRAIADGSFDSGAAAAAAAGGPGFRTGLDDPDAVGPEGPGMFTGPTTLGREDSLKVLSASNTILALVLVGVLVLQAGQWYAERKQQQEEAAIAKERAEARAEREKEGGTGKDREHRSPGAGSKKKV